MRQRVRLAGARPRDNQERAAVGIIRSTVLDCTQLFRIQIRERKAYQRAPARIVSPG